jgi:hypothetical protein
MLSSRTTVTVQPSYSQFYLKRGDAEWASESVSDEGYEARLEVIDGFVYVGVSMYGNPTEVTFEVYDSLPTEIIPEADHVVEASITSEGPMCIFSWGDDFPEVFIDTPSGPLRLRASWKGIAAALARPDREGTSDEVSPESLVFQVWPAPVRPQELLRAWTAD